MKPQRLNDHNLLGFQKKKQKRLPTIQKSG